MSLPNDKSRRLGSSVPVNSFDSIDSTDVRARQRTPHETQLTSDPPTVLRRRDSFRELPPGSVVEDTYEIDARLGAGAMGEVYAARHLKLGKRVAIKVISQRLSEDAAAIERFAMEARTLAQIQHPAIVAVEHVGELADGRAYFVMEMLRGESLFERLHRGRIPLPEALRILDQMARGLDAAHAQGITHRDIKPENTFLVHLPGEPSMIKLVDFGLSKLRVADERAERTQSGVAIGTPMYMSPEQMRGPDVDHRTDIYALGCVAYEMVLGQPPFPHARAAPELYAAHLHETPPLPRSIWPEIPPQLDLALFAMLAKDPAHRPTLEQFRAVIANVRSPSPAQQAATEFVGRRAPNSTARKLKITLIAIAALIGGVTIGAVLTSETKRNLPSMITPIVPVTAPPVTSTIEQIPPPTIQPPDVSPALPVVDTIDKAKSTARAPSAPPSRGTKRRGNSGVIAPTIPVPQHVDAGITETPDAPQHSIDRNQTINPFKRKANP